jgi:hypothetical protein
MRAWYALAGLLLASGCSEQSEPRAAAAARDVAELTAADSARVLAEGGAIATTVAQGLAQRLQAELATAGAAGAVDFCARTALALTDSLVAATAAHEVKRTSSRIRNPRNTPDDYERMALAWFDSVRTTTGVLPAAHVQLAGEDELRFYRPLLIAPFCTQCHGAPEQLDPEVRRILAERYPADQATGYVEGDMRGVIRVSLPQASLQPR